MLKKTWAEILVFGAILTVLLVCNLPSMTWVNTDSDGPHYILSAKYFGVAHNTSAPLFLLLGRLFLYLPFGTDAWRMGLISVIATLVCSILIYKAIRVQLSDNSKSRWYGLIGVLIYGGSALVISQSTIIESYALSTMFAVAAYYMTLEKKWVLTAVMLGLILAIHPLFFLMTWLVLFIAHREMRRVKTAIIPFFFIAFYAYIPIAKILGEGVVGMWGNSSVAGFLKNNFGTMWMLAGGLSLYDLPKRILDTIAILGVSLGFGAIISAWYFIRRKSVKGALLWLMLIPTIYFIANLAAETYVYMMPSIAFAAIATGIGLSKLKVRWAIATAVIAVGLLGFNANYFDIGRTLDPNLSAQRFYDEELPKLSDGSIYLGGGWTWAIVYLYNKQEEKNIVPVCTDILPSEEYLEIIQEQGIHLTPTNSERHIDKQWENALSIAESNDNVWLARETVPSEYQYELVPAKDNMDLITRWIGYELEPEIAWKPSNPYKFITGALEVSEWKFILKTEHNVRFAVAWMTFAILPYWLFLKFWDRRKKKKAA